MWWITMQPHYVDFTLQLILFKVREATSSYFVLELLSLQHLPGGESKGTTSSRAERGSNDSFFNFMELVALHWKQEPDCFQ